MLNTGHSITCLHHLYQPTPVCHMFMLLSQTEFISFSAASNFHVNSFFRFFISFIFVFTRTWLCYIRVRAIANPSVCLSVCNVHAPYSAGWNFPQYFFAIRYLSHHLLTYIQNFSLGASNTIGSKIERWWTYWWLCRMNATRYVAVI